MFLVACERNSADKINKKAKVIIWHWLNLSQDGNKKSPFDL